MKFVHTADTHLGFDCLKVAWPDPDGRRRRAEAITQNFHSVIEHAEYINADFLLHAGDLFNKYYFPDELAADMVRPLINLAASGIPVIVIPGNHERSSFPFDLFHGVANLYVLATPQTVVLTIDGLRVGISGFPYLRNDSRRVFSQALNQTKYQHQRTDLQFLIAHQAFDSAVVGPHDFTFTSRRPDTVDRFSVPPEFRYVAAGHIHRWQILLHPSAPGVQIVYPGSTQRISYAEIHEDKGFIEGETVGQSIVPTFRQLPVYDMERVTISAGGRSAAEVLTAIEEQSWRFHENLVIRFVMIGAERLSDYPRIDYQALRAALPPVLECQFLLAFRGGAEFR